MVWMVSKRSAANNHFFAGSWVAVIQSEWLLVCRSLCSIRRSNPVLVDLAQIEKQSQEDTRISLYLSRGKLKPFNQFDLDVSETTALIWLLSSVVVVMCLHHIVCSQDGMAHLFRGAYATMSEQQKDPQLLHHPFYKPLSLNDVLDTEVKGWERMSAKKLRVCSLQTCMQMWWSFMKHTQDVATTLWYKPHACNDWTAKRSNLLYSNHQCHIDAPSWCHILIQTINLFRFVIIFCRWGTYWNRLPLSSARD